MTKLAEVHTLYPANARQIPAMLRRAADSIETEEAEGFSPTNAMVAVQVTANGSIRVYGWGDVDNIRAIGLLHLGLQEIGSIQLSDGDDE